MIVPTTDNRVTEAVNRIRALRRLTADTGVKTYKSQSALLESLPADVLATVALVLNPEKENVNEHCNNQPR
jgi:hypothetical protein